jgi:hypothetical protein
MKGKLSIVALIAVLFVAASWAAHRIDFVGLIKRLHGG